MHETKNLFSFHFIHIYFVICFENITRFSFETSVIGSILRSDQLRLISTDIECNVQNQNILSLFVYLEKVDVQILQLMLEGKRKKRKTFKLDRHVNLKSLFIS